MDNGNIRAPSIRIDVTPRYLMSGIDWAGEVKFDLGGESLLRWTIYDRLSDNVLYESSDYTVNDDGTATFSHTFPPTISGDTYTITQDVIVT